MKSLLFIVFLFSILLGSVQAADSENELGKLSIAALKYVSFESTGDWEQCYKMFSSLITQKISMKAFRSWMENSPIRKSFEKPVRANMSRLEHQDVELGRVIVRDANAPGNDLTRVASLILIKEGGEWRIVSVSGLRSHSIIDEMFFCQMIAKEIQANKSKP